MIAMALACRPKLLIADEPTTALDVTIQAQILGIIRDLQRELHMAVIFITHDMGVVAEMADDVVVMHRGRKVEEASVEDIFARPQAVYTQTLLSAVPKLGAHDGRGSAAPRSRDGRSRTASRSASATATSRTPPATTARRSFRSKTSSPASMSGRACSARVTHRIHAVEGVSFDIYPGETLALVGESGSGKSTIGRTIQQLQKATGGDIRFDGRLVSEMSAAERMRLRQEVQYIFQDPFASLDPRKTVGFSVAEPIRTHSLLDNRAAIDRRVAELLERVGLEAGHASRYPHEFSGGQRQRVCIARALASNPKLIIADEALSALDVSIQAQIINLLMELQEQEGLAYLFISHDMAVVEKISHRVAVLYLGQVVEFGPRRAIFENPSHPYTQRLLSAVPVAEPGLRRDRPLLEGEIASPLRRVGDEPAILTLDERAPGHFVASDTDLALSA